MHRGAAFVAEARRGSPSGEGLPSLLERFPISTTRDRWLDALPLEHATLPLPEDFSRDGGDLLVHRGAAVGRPISGGRVPRRFVPGLLLQAASALAFFETHGLWLGEEDLLAATFDGSGDAARLTLSRSPAALRGARAGPPPSEVLSAFLDRIDRRRRGSPAGCVLLREALRCPAASARRSEFWVASLFRAFPELASQAQAGSRIRTVGFGGEFLRDPAVRARLEKARVLLSGRFARVFEPGPPHQPGGALALSPPPITVREASRRLRERASAEARGRSSVWIAAEWEVWDDFSRRALASAGRALSSEVEIRVLPSCPRPLLPDEWRREIFVPCGSLAASMRFYEWLSEAAPQTGVNPLGLVRGTISASGWGPFVTDSTGAVPVPASDPPLENPASAVPPRQRDLRSVLAARGSPASPAELARLCGVARIARELSALEQRGEAVRTPGGWRITPTGAGRAAADPPDARALRRRAARETDRQQRILLLLAAGDSSAALEEGRLLCGDPDLHAERWFDLSARLGRAADPSPPWLDQLEARRELAGGRPDEAQRLLERAAASPLASGEERRRVLLALAEVKALAGGIVEAARAAAAWRRGHPGAPAGEIVRALRLEARGLARSGRHEEAHRLLDRADRSGASLPDSERIETVLARAGVFSREGRFREEEALYQRWRARALADPDERVAARFLSSEALGLCDRRRFGPAAARLEQALSVLRDDPSERARVLVDLAATLYHGGRPARCGPLLEEAIACAVSSGREDLVRIARSNRIELWIREGEWTAAAGEIEDLAGRAASDGDDLWRLVALHHRGRLALRRGDLGRAREDNASARRIAERLGDRLETGELWLEEGDRLLYEGEIEGARAAWERAAADPPDRCDSAGEARGRLAELGWSREGTVPEEARRALEETFAQDQYVAAETVARWVRLLPEGAGPGQDLRGRAERSLRSRGGDALADRIFGAGETPAVAGPEPLRDLRDTLARALAGTEPGRGIEAFGLEGLGIADETGREVLRLGRVPEGSCRRRLEAGTSSYTLALAPDPGASITSAIAWLAETLLFHLPDPPAADGFAAGWLRFGILTADPAMEEPYRRLLRFAKQSITVLVCGESGSGKEAVARAVHAISTRAAAPFVPINVPAIPGSLVESELFGHCRGAFTGADRDRAGLLEEASRGTAFFDEIGDLEIPLQAKLLRTLQERELRRVGENRSRRIDVRVVSATSRDLAREVEAGRFREDLYYRLNVAVIPLPPLRERGRDVMLLSRHFLLLFGREFERGELRLSAEASAALAAHSWPGNVRELQNAIAHAAALCEPGGIVGLDHLPESIGRAARPAAGRGTYRSRVDAHRRGLIADALERAGGNRSRAARDLGLSRQALLYLIRELNVPCGARSPR